MKKYIIKVCYYSDRDVIIFPHDYPFGFGDNIMKETERKKIIILSGSDRIKKKLRRRKLDELLSVHSLFELYPSFDTNKNLLVMREFVV